MIKDILILAENLARQAGQYARSQLGLAQTEYKLGHQIVTAVDRRCQALIIEGVRREFSGHGFIAEEPSDPKAELFKDPPLGAEDTWWILDPLDGTRNFANGVPQFAISIGVLRQGMPIVGVIYDPSTDRMYTGSLETPARCNGKEIHAQGAALHDDSQIAIPSHYRDGTPLFIDEFLKHYICQSLGSAALHYAYVAQGSFAACVSRDVRLWDIAGGAAITQAAGCLITDLEGQEIFPFNCAGYQGEPLPVLFAPPQIHTPLLDIIRFSIPY